MRDLMLLAIENLGRLLMEFAMRHRQVYTERSIAEMVKEAWAPTAPEIRS